MSIKTSNNVLDIHNSIINDYASYVKSYINISDPEISSVVHKEIEEGKLWPEPLIQFNPAYKFGSEISALIDSGILDKELANVFKDYKLYKHQVDAIKLGASGKSFIVTSGTGSGKSLTYMGTIFNELFKNPDSSGIKAVIVYPMNALINSQTIELNRYKEAYEINSGQEFPIRFAQYTGQEGKDSRTKILEDPPHILLTNYMMLELILTRIQEKSIRESIFADLKYLVFDELHTYRGRQGADVSLLIRRIRAKSNNNIVSIGTSATMVSGGTLSDQLQKVAAVGSKIFGSKFTSAQIISETLERSFSFNGVIPDSSELKKVLNNPIDIEADESVLVNHPLAIWLENRIALIEKDNSLARNLPLQLNSIVDALVEDAKVDFNKSIEVISQLMQWISNVNIRKSGEKTYLPYKIHQFISQTGTCYITLDREVITLEPGAFSSTENDKKPLFPIVFSRVSGHEFICVNVNESSGKLEPREFRERLDDEFELSTDGYIVVGVEVWDPANDISLLPDAWINERANGTYSVIKKYRERVPRKIYFDEQGRFSFDSNNENWGWFMPAPLLFDPTSGTIYDPRTNEGTKLTKLGSEGRSTSTTISTFNILQHLAANGYTEENQKLLSFTDNRQDAALQAGHFNDFISVIQLRAAIYNALLSKDDNRLDHSIIGKSISDALNLQQDEFSLNPSTFPGVIKENEDALIDYLTYRALFDLRRGWRVILPNLEQCALLKINFKWIDENCSHEEAWKSVPYFKNMNVELRKKLVFQILDYFRRSYAIHSEEYLNIEQIKRRRKIINEKLKLPWKFGESEKIQEPCFMHYEAIRAYSTLYTASAGYSSALGKYIRGQIKTFSGDTLGREQYEEFMPILLELLENAGWLKSSPIKRDDNSSTKVYQLLIDKIVWQLGDGETVQVDEVRSKSYKEISLQPNQYFQEIYKTDFSTLKKYIGHEHTGQLNNEDRQEREQQFRSGEISALYCSPTMELGIDIASLNVVHMRNAPPNPANYAQRSGRAGRSGQAAFVFTYCSNFSAHDRHYFHNATDLVAGSVAPPLMELANEELLITHLNAIFLAEVGLPELNHSISDIIDDTSRDELPINEKVKSSLLVPETVKNRIASTFNEVIKDFVNEKLISMKWFNEAWINNNINNFTLNLDNSLNRWRILYKSASAQLADAQKIIDSGRFTKTSPEMRAALRDLNQALRQRDLLTNKVKGQLSEFYPFRYFASEGLLPGYNFTRLPLRTFIPSGNSGQYISRPRTIAIREFGPGNIIYHNGSKFRINQLIMQDIEEGLNKAKVSVNSGYILTGKEYTTEICPFSKVDLSSNENRKLFVNLVNMGETRTEEIDRISCEEEERVSKGFDLETYFNVPGGLDSITTALVKSDEETLLKIQYIPTAQLVHINTRWRVSRENGFPVGLTTGFWKKSSQTESEEEIRRIQLQTTDTADSLYIQPIKSLALSPEGVITLQYAIKRAIEDIFQVESREIGATKMGDPKQPNIFIYEAAEGSLGVLSQFVEDPNKFDQIIDHAIQLLRYDDEDYKDPASYNDLLSYFNQRDHGVIDRFLIKDALEKLKACNVEIITNTGYKDYEQHYTRLMRAIDPNSSTEKEFVEYLYRNNLRLPDSAQKRVKDIYVQPDFFYEPDVWVFCDGTPHDENSVQADDKEKRQAILNRGDQVVVYYYKDSLDELVKKRSDIFRKVR